MIIVDGECDDCKSMHGCVQQWLKYKWIHRRANICTKQHIHTRTQRSNEIVHLLVVFYCASQRFVNMNICLLMYVSTI